MSAYTDEELATLARQCHEYMAPHDSPTHYNDEGLCDQCVVIVRWFAGAVLPDHDRQLRADTLNELADNLVRLLATHEGSIATVIRAQATAALAAPVVPRSLLEASPPNAESEILRELETPCYCGETSTRNCPRHAEPIIPTDEWGL